ncbi:helix-hairpin-helix domain-containing protein, partial [Candidatus Aerophobetes bacterium]|nr:helix-hairpin-helix domain-containing protein [Candidatus Aerophobetes bacterium]
MQILGETNIDFIRFSKIAFAISLVVIIIGLSSIIIRGGLKLGLDFTGGVETQIKFEKPLQVAQIREALSQVGLGRAVIQSYGNPKENTFLVRYHLEKISQDIASAIINYRKEKGEFKNIEELKKIPEIEELGYENLSNVFTTNPEEKDKININTASMETLASAIDDINSRNIASKIKEALDEKVGEKNPFEILSINLIGPKVSRELQKNALLAITFGLIGMLIYIAWR